MKRIRTTPGRAVIHAAEGGRPRTFTMTAYTGEAMRIEGFPLPVVIDCASLDATVQAVPALLNHRPDQPVGQVQSVRCAGRPPIVASGVFTPSGAADDKAAEVVNRADLGYEWQVSVAGNPASLDRYEAGETFQANGRTYQGPALLARGLKLREISFVTIGGDAATSAVVAAGTGDSPMDFDTWLDENGFADIGDDQRAALAELYNQANPPTMTEDLEDGPVAAGAMASAIRTAAQKYGNPTMTVAGELVDVATHAIRAGWTPAQTEVQAMRAQLRRPPSNHPGGGGVAIERQAMEAGVLIRAGFQAAAERSFSPQVLDASRRYQSMSLMDVAAYNLRASGAPVPHDRQDMIRAAFSSASLTTMFSNVSGKILETVWREQPATWQNFCAVRSAANFKQQTSLRPTFANTLSPLPETGQIDHGSMNEEYFTWQIASYAKMYTFDRQAVINDDLGSFSEIMPGLVRAAARTLSDLVYATILANPSSFFHSSHSNLLTSSALTGATLAAAIKATKLQRDPSGNALDLLPEFLIVPPALEQTARGILNSSEIARSTATDSQLPTGNTLENAAKLVVESRLENGCTNPGTGTAYSGSATSWYMAASAADIPMVVGFLDGKQTPTVETFGLNADPNRLALSWRVYHDFGCATGDYRAFRKATA